MPSLVGSEMCIRDRAYHAKTMGKGFSPTGNSELLAHVAGAASAGGSKSELRKARAMLVGGNPQRALYELQGASEVPGRRRTLQEAGRLMKGTGNERLVKRYLRRAYSSVRKGSSGG